MSENPSPSPWAKEPYIIAAAQTFVPPADAARAFDHRFLLEHRPPYFPTLHPGCYLSTTDVAARQWPAYSQPGGKAWRTRTRNT